MDCTPSNDEILFIDKSIDRKDEGVFNKITGFCNLLLEKFKYWNCVKFWNIVEFIGNWKVNEQLEHSNDWMVVGKDWNKSIGCTEINGLLEREIFIKDVVFNIGGYCKLLVSIVNSVILIKFVRFNPYPGMEFVDNNNVCIGEDGSEFTSIFNVFMVILRNCNCEALGWKKLE